MKYDYLIVGQGLAGSLLAHELLRRKKSVFLVSDPILPSSSRVAGGMYNPVTGKHLAKTWLAETIFPAMHEFYGEIEQLFSCSIVHPADIYRPYANENHREQFLKAISRFHLEEYVTHHEKNDGYEEFIRNPFGGIMTTHSGWIDVPRLLDVLREHFLSLGILKEEAFDYESLRVLSDGIECGELRAGAVIFCEGFHARHNPWFNWLPFNPVKGETLIVRMPNFPLKEIINQGKWVLPVSDTVFRIGATYNWHQLDFEPTDDARQYLLGEISRFLKSKTEIIGQQAGVRPATRDRRPIMGPHPLEAAIHIFNGLGTKGVSLAPYFAINMADFLEGKKEIHPETTIERFYALYYNEKL